METARPLSPPAGPVGRRTRMRAWRRRAGKAGTQKVLFDWARPTFL